MKNDITRTESCLFIYLFFKSEIVKLLIWGTLKCANPFWLVMLKSVGVKNLKTKILNFISTIKQQKNDGLPLYNYFDFCQFLWAFIESFLKKTADL